MKVRERIRYFKENWPTNKGAWFPGEKVLFRNKSLFDDFSDKSWMTLLLYGISGKMPTEPQAKIVEKLWMIGTSFPDSRLWNNRVAALAGTARSTGSLAIAAATAVSEAKVFGAKPLFLGSKFLHEIKEHFDSSVEFERVVIDRLKKDRYLPGFGRPIISQDERIEPLLKELKSLGYCGGDYLSLVNKVSEVLKNRRFRIKPNIAIYCSAVLADLGFDPTESYLIAVLTFSAGMFPCFIDGCEKNEGCLFPLECSDIEYRGHGKRRYEC